jgi:hypothetical protein
VRLEHKNDKMSNLTRISSLGDPNVNF